MQTTFKFKLTNDTMSRASLEKAKKVKHEWVVTIRNIEVDLHTSIRTLGF